MRESDDKLFFLNELQKVETEKENLFSLLQTVWKIMPENGNDKKFSMQAAVGTEVLAKDGSRAFLT